MRNSFKKCLEDRKREIFCFVLFGETVKNDLTNTKFLRICKKRIELLKNISETYQFSTEILKGDNYGYILSRKEKKVFLPEKPYKIYEKIGKKIFSYLLKYINFKLN